MSKRFRIQPSSNPLQAGPGAAPASFAVTNLTEEMLRFRARALCEGGTAGWAALADEAEANLPPGDTRRLELTLLPPEGAGALRVSLELRDVNDPSYLQPSEWIPVEQEAAEPGPVSPSPPPVDPPPPDEPPPEPPVAASSGPAEGPAAPSPPERTAAPPRDDDAAASSGPSRLTLLLVIGLVLLGGAVLAVVLWRALRPDPGGGAHDAGAPIVLLDSGVIDTDSGSGSTPIGPELCNGLDDDGNGRIDDLPEVGTPCSQGLGICKQTGRIRCVASTGQLECSARALRRKVERCPANDRNCAVCRNGLDDDCDGLVDSRDNDCPAPLELCNGRDDDRDDRIDEDFPDKGQVCRVGTGICQRQGRKICSEDGRSLRCNVSAGPSRPEICNNGRDDDCDGAVDRLDPDCRVVPLRSVTLFEHANYRGRSRLVAADTPNLASGTSFNDMASSLRLSSGTRVTLYENSNYRGRALILCKASPNLQMQKLPGGGDLNDRVSSLRIDNKTHLCRAIQVEPRTSVVLFEHAGYRGRQLSLGVGRHSLAGGRNFNDLLSSLKVRGARVVLYEHSNFSGKAQVICRDTENLSTFRISGGTNWNDRASSVLIDRKLLRCPQRLPGRLPGLPQP